MRADLQASLCLVLGEKGLATPLTAPKGYGDAREMLRLTPKAARIYEDGEETEIVRPGIKLSKASALAALLQEAGRLNDWNSYRALRTALIASVIALAVFAAAWVVGFVY